MRKYVPGGMPVGALAKRRRRGLVAEGLVAEGLVAERAVVATGIV